MEFAVIAIGLDNRSAIIELEGDIVNSDFKVLGINEVKKYLLVEFRKNWPASPGLYRFAFLINESLKHEHVEKGADIIGISITKLVIPNDPISFELFDSIKKYLNRIFTKA